MLLDRSAFAEYFRHYCCRPNADTTKAMAKMIKQEGEATKVAVRAARKSLMEQVKKLPSKDMQRQLEKQVTWMAHEKPINTWNVIRGRAF